MGSALADWHSLVGSSKDYMYKKKKKTKSWSARTWVNPVLGAVRIYTLHSPKSSTVLLCLLKIAAEKWRRHQGSSVLPFYRKICMPFSQGALQLTTESYLGRTVPWSY